MGIVLLDQVVLEDQGLILIAGYDEINRIYLLDKGCGLGVAARKEV